MRVTFAAENGHLDCLKYLHETAKAPWDEEAVREARDNYHPECVQYLLDNDCPLPPGWRRSEAKSKIERRRENKTCNNKSGSDAKCTNVFPTFGISSFPARNNSRARKTLLHYYFYATLFSIRIFLLQKKYSKRKKSERFITTIMTDDDDDINEYQHPIDGLDHWVNLLNGFDFAFSYTYVSCSAGKEETEERKFIGERYAFEASKAGENVHVRDDIFLLDDADDGGERKGE